MALGGNIEVDSGSYTPESLRLRRRLAETMLQQGMSTAPVGHWSQGLNRILQAMLGGRQISEIEAREKGQEQSANEAILGLLGPVGSGATAGPVTQESPPAASGAPQASFLGEVGPSTGESQPIAGGMDAWKRAIASIESASFKNPYEAIGPKTRSGDRAYGKYQVMGENIPEWTQKHLGRRMTIDEFRASPEAQERVFEREFGGYVAKYGNPQDAASVWFSGVPVKQGANRDDQYTSQPEYLRRFNAALTRDAKAGGGQQAIPTQVADASGSTPAATMPQVDPAVRARIGQLLANPATKQLGMAMVQQIALQQPKIQEIETVDQFGRKQKLNATYNPQTRRYEALEVAGGSQPAQAPSMPAQAAQPLPSAPSAPQAVQQAAAIGRPMLGGDELSSQFIGEVGPSGVRQQDGGQSDAQTSGMIPGPAAREDQIGTGFMQRTDAQGRPLWQQVNGALQPVIEPKAAAEARGKAQEALAVKKGEAQQAIDATKEQAVGNISRLGEVINDATPDEWLLGAGQYGGSSASLTDDPVTYAVGSAKRAGVALGELVGGTPREGRSAHGLRQDLNSAAADLVMTYRAIQKSRGVADSQQSNADLEFLKDVVGQLPTSNSREEASRILNDSVRPIFERLTGEKIAPITLKQWKKVPAR